MTTNQTIALLFPLIGAAAIFATGVLIVQPWKRGRSRVVYAIETIDMESDTTGLVVPPAAARHLDQDLKEADRLIQHARRQIQPASRV
jgi:hypothetical protein